MFYLLNKKVVTTPKHSGGLGIPQLLDKNYAVLIHFHKNLFHYIYSLWSTVLRSKCKSSTHLTSHPLLPITSKPYHSYFWKSLTKTTSLIRSDTTWNIAVGHLILLWSDKWIQPHLSQHKLILSLSCPMNSIHPSLPFSIIMFDASTATPFSYHPLLLLLFSALSPTHTSTRDHLTGSPLPEVISLQLQLIISTSNIILLFLLSLLSIGFRLFLYSLSSKLSSGSTSIIIFLHALSLLRVDSSLVPYALCVALLTKIYFIFV